MVVDSEYLANDICWDNRWTPYSAIAGHSSLNATPSLTLSLQQAKVVVGSSRLPVNENTLTKVNVMVSMSLNVIALGT